MKKEYLVWGIIPIILLLSLYIDSNSHDIMFPMILFTGIISVVLLIMGFVYKQLEIRNVGNQLGKFVVNICLFYTLFHPLFAVLASLLHMDLGKNWLSHFLKSGAGFRFFFIIQLVPILMLLSSYLIEKVQQKK